jgi:DNA-binding Lrp family transcriptional regulator
MGHKRGPEVDDGTRGAIVGLHKKARLPFTDITNLTGVPETTAKNIMKHAVANTKESLGREAFNLSNDTLEE